MKREGGGTAANRKEPFTLQEHLQLRTKQGRKLCSLTLGRKKRPSPRPPGFCRHSAVAAVFALRQSMNAVVSPLVSTELAW